MTRDEELYALEETLDEYSGMQVFNTHNTTGDTLVTIFNNYGIEVYYCEAWNYLEIFGLTEEEYNNFTMWDDFTHYSRVVKYFNN